MNSPAEPEYVPAGWKRVRKSGLHGVRVPLRWVRVRRGELASLDSLTRKLVATAQDGPHNQIESKPEIEPDEPVEAAIEQCETL